MSTRRNAGRLEWPVVDYLTAMAQISSDLEAFGESMRSVDEAVTQIAATIAPVSGIETVPLARADSRVLVQDLVASVALPPFTNSAVDGYAVRFADVAAARGAPIAIANRVMAGSAAKGAVSPGQATRIFTGAPMPEGADTVFMQEDVRLDHAGRVHFPEGLRCGANVRPIGEDVAVGQVVLPKGRRLRPQDVAVCAALGLVEIDVRRSVRVAVISTGDEIVSPGSARSPSQLFDSNRFMLAAMLRRLGCEVGDFGILADDPVLIADALRAAAARHDLILASGGVSTGEADHVRAGVESAGRLVFWRVAIKPGRPIAMGSIIGVPFMGLPGNPVASFVTFAYFARAAVLALAGAVSESFVSTPVRSAFLYRKKAGRREYLRANIRRGADGGVEAVKFPREGAGLLSSLIETDGLVELPEAATGVEPGETVAFLPYSILL
jgi:molybdopterin molybdotransferase